jgi:hypothetical protein
VRIFNGLVCKSVEDEPWAQLSPGQTVKLRGLFANEKLRCAIVSKGPDPAVSVTAEHLAKEFATDADAADRKYNKKYLRLTGEVVGREPGEDKWFKIVLKGADGCRAVFSFPGMQRMRKMLDLEVKTGAKVKALCKYQGFNATMRELTLEQAQFIYETK